MIGFEGGSLFKLSPVSPASRMEPVGLLLVEGECIITGYLL